MTSRPIERVLTEILTSLREEVADESGLRRDETAPATSQPPSGHFPFSVAWGSRWLALIPLLVIVGAVGLLKIFNPRVLLAGVWFGATVAVAVSAATFWLIKCSQPTIIAVWNRFLFGPQTSIIAACDDAPDTKDRGAVQLGWARALGLSIPASAFAVAALAGWLGFFEPSYSTAIGETRTFRLPDGSDVTLNTQSRLRWTASGANRRVELLEGEALFNIAKIPGRPFQITIGRSAIRDIGTSLDVYLKHDGSVVVTVLSGVVMVEGSPEAGWQRRVSANQRIEYTPAGVTRDVQAVDALEKITWRDGFIMTSGEPLSVLLPELNRYSSKPIVSKDPRLNARDIAGAFRVDDIPVALSRLEILLPIVVTQTDDSYVLKYRADSLQR